MGNKNLIYDFSFVGSARAPEQRYWDLLELLDRTAIQLWIDEPITNQRKSYFLDRKRLESDFRSQIRNRTKSCLKVVGATGLELLVGKDRVPRKIKSLAKEIISEIANLIPNKVSLERPDWEIVIQVMGKITGIGIFPSNSILSVSREKRLGSN